ncbi:MAG: hypothetical protein Ta2E_09280 [Mycoplasmoidaceae bacterium]|nr:MAG: hypothetical protein Ta2E_09280 [Mycoplasmoidaceae bacterium]
MDVVKEKRELFIASLDLRDAFGSIPHDLIRRNVEDFGFPKRVSNIIMESYNGASISIQAKQDYSEQVPREKGVKQGCPISPTLFNIGIDPLLRVVNRELANLGYE